MPAQPAASSPWVASPVPLDLTNHPDDALSALRVDPVTSTNVYALSLVEGVFKSSDGGQTWASASVGLPPPPPPLYAGVASSFLSLAIDPRVPTNVYTFYVWDKVTPSAPSGVYKSTDGGQSWTLANNGLTSSAGSARAELVIDPVTPSTLYVDLLGKAAELWKSVDAGATWTLAATSSAGSFPGSAHELTIDPSAPTTLYVAGEPTGGLYRSTDGGQTWTPLPGSGAFQQVAVDPRTSSTIYAVASTPTVPQQLRKSIDGGATWTNLSYTIQNASANVIVVDPATPTTVYIGYTGSPTLLKTTDGGATWLDIGAGQFPPNVSGFPAVSALAIDPTAPLTLYATNGGPVVLKTTTGGQ